MEGIQFFFVPHTKLSYIHFYNTLWCFLVNLKLEGFDQCIFLNLWSTKESHTGLKLLLFKYYLYTTIAFVNILN